jgi:hypothetical protein
MKQLKLKFGLIVGLILLLMGVTAVSASNKTVTSGEFHTFVTGIERGYEIGGQALLVRSSYGRTQAHIKAWGLVPNTLYPAHVHNAPCAVNNGGGHYQDVVGGPVDSVNEIWPGVNSDGYGFGTGHASNNFIARPEAQSMVIHDTDGARIACADLN